jgi:xylulokinase
VAKRYLLAHDLGTSGNKATLFDVDGKLIDSRTSAYQTRYFNANWAEQQPGDWWQAVCRSSRELLAGRDPREIGAVALSGQMMGCLCVDGQGRPLRPSIIYADQRAAEQTDRILQRVEPAEFYRITGHRASPSYSIEKLAWLKDHEPEVYRATHKMLNAKDYVNFLLTGVLATDYSDASGTNAFDLNTYRWSERVIDAAGVDGAMLPELKPSTDVLGAVTREAAEATGLREGTPVAVGGGDGVCAGVGVGCVKPGIAYNYLGSSSWIALAVEKPVYDESMRTMTWAHAVPGLFQPSGTMQTAGAALAWVKNEVCTLEARLAEEQGISPYELINRQIEESPPGARGLLFLPYLLGERSPRWNPDAKGAFIGLTLTHKRADLLRAVLEGITYNLEIILGILRQSTTIDGMTVVGGGAQSSVWRQMMADVYNLEIRKPNYLEEATSMGAAVLGGIASGLFPDFDVIDRFLKVECAHRPNPEARQR